MNNKIRTLATTALAVLTIVLFASAQTVSAAAVCQKVKGNINLVNNGNGTFSGTITQGGQLNGTVQAVFTSVFTPTPDPTTFSFTDTLSLTTNKGSLSTRNIGIFDVAAGLFGAIDRIDPNAGTGDFAGATGVLYLNGKTTDGGATFQAEITGEICFAN